MAEVKLTESDREQLAETRRILGMKPAEEEKPRSCLKCRKKFETIKSVRICSKCKNPNPVRDAWIY